MYKENWMADRVNDLEYALKVAKDALKFYSERGNYIEWNSPREVLLDNGLRARTALERINERIGKDEETN
jgi:hypothetical protein